MIVRHNWIWLIVFKWTQRLIYDWQTVSHKLIFVLGEHFLTMICKFSLWSLHATISNIYYQVTSKLSVISNLTWGRRGSDRMVVGFTTTYAIGAFHHWFCEFQSQSRWGVQHYVIKFVSDLLQVGGFLWVLRFPPPIKLTWHHWSHFNKSLINIPVLLLICFTLKCISDRISHLRLCLWLNIALRNPLLQSKSAIVYIYDIEIKFGSIKDT